ncbi:PP2C family serine/threonine-protein phosphatase [Selenomonas ruminantium]|uniref:Serine/threonine protein phosphatase PrpC n=1 Tax=Selenomonas ruminantium TaxID=971 RepID=A0A1K1NLG7_SELRU|nr:PP2C family serine/threonine-protein phosphatase [Selenomonas ruminantium]SFW36143.1 Serine/threonine protein phosphatase PrpC [Selenomonas ruminantium]
MDLIYGWQAIGYSCQGRAHLRTGLPNQDYWLQGGAEDYMLAAVSDGMGSCPQARLGAQATCRAFQAAAKEFLAYGQGELIVDDPRGYLQRVAALRTEIIRFKGVELRDADSTGLLAFFYEDRVLLAQLGDGVVLAIDALGRPLRILHDGKTESFLNQVRGFGSSGMARGWKAAVLPQALVEAVLLCTDGVEMEPLAEYAHLAADLQAEAVGGISSCQRAICQLLEDWPRYGSQDDKTLVFAFKSQRSKL